MKTVTEYLRYAEGRKIDTDGVPKQPYQCADLIKDMFAKVWNIRGFSFTLPDLNPYGYAKSIYENFNSYPQLKGKFSRIKNTPSLVPQKGDIVVWGTYEGITGEAGHIAVALGEETDTTKKFTSLDQNWHKKYYVCRTEHNYRGVLGVIRPLLKVTAVDVNIRRGPGVTFKKIGDKEKGEVVRPLTYKNGWAQIAEGQWICAKYLD